MGLPCLRCTVQLKSLLLLARVAEARSPTALRDVTLRDRAPRPLRPTEVTYTKHLLRSRARVTEGCRLRQQLGAADRWSRWPELSWQG